MHPVRYVFVSFSLVSSLLWAQGVPTTSPPVGGSVPTTTESATSGSLQDSTKLEVLNRVAATYPPEAKAAGLQGKTVVKISVTEFGDVSGTEVISGELILATACEAALKQWKFKPFVRNGKPVPVTSQLPCEFKIPDSPMPVVSIEDRSSKSKEATNPEAPTKSAIPPDSTALVLIRKVKAVYPTEATQKEIQGEVVVKIIVDENGSVGEWTVIRGNPILSQAVVDAVKKWKFDPFIRSGKPVKAATSLSYDFAFKDQIILDKPYDPAKDPNLDPTVPRRVRISSGVTAGLLVYKVAPVYPMNAKMAHIQGTVVLAAIIGKDGKVKELRAMSGPPELVEASIGAVQQWRYKPYLLMGEPVEVDTQITVNFTLRY